MQKQILKITIIIFLVVICFSGCFGIGGNIKPIIYKIDIKTPQINSEQYSSTYQFVVRAKDPEGGGLTYKWDFGDGFGGYGWPIHTYRNIQDYTVTVVVTDSLGAVAIRTTNFTPDKIGKNIEEQGDLILTPMLSGDVEKVKFNYLLLRKSFPGMLGNWRISGKMENIYDETFEHLQKL